jgi:Raf kinase inhibitor-like YbhB/YbcL family protein
LRKDHLFHKSLLAALLTLLALPLGAGAEPKAKPSFHIGSKSFKAGQAIPDLYTCKGKNISPELFWKGAPTQTQSFALIVEDPDASLQVWTHWLIYNIPIKKAGPDGNVYELSEGYPRDEVGTGGILQGLNDFRKLGYDGPCPSGGVHRYYFKLYALSALLPVGAGLTKEQFEGYLKGHVLAETQLVGTFGQ